MFILRQNSKGIFTLMNHCNSSKYAVDVLGQFTVVCETKVWVRESDPFLFIPDVDANTVTLHKF